MSYDSLVQEFERRKKMWSILLENGGSTGVTPNIIRDLGIYGGAQGIWVDKMQTGQLTKGSSGITVSLTHSGSSYPDDWSDESVIYHYPVTNRPRGRDISEIEATKNAGKLGLPLFVITHTSHSKRNVFIGWVADWDDEAKQFLVIFDKELSLSRAIPVKILEEVKDEAAFNLFQHDEGIRRTIAGRRNQQRFKFQVFKRYSPICAVCGLKVLALLQAAHIVPKEQYGSDDPRNGLVLCANHHLAFDTNLFAIEPENLEICYRQTDIGADTLQINFRDLQHLIKEPHQDAIKWRYDTWKRSN